MAGDDPMIVCHFFDTRWAFTSRSRRGSWSKILSRISGVSIARSCAVEPSILVVMSFEPVSNSEVEVGVGVGVAGALLVGR